MNRICERLSIPYRSLFSVSLRPKPFVHQKSVGLFLGSGNTKNIFFPYKLMVLYFVHLWLTKVFIGMLYFWMGDAVITVKSRAKKPSGLLIQPTQTHHVHEFNAYIPNDHFYSYYSSISRYISQVQTKCHLTNLTFIADMSCFIYQLKS